MPPPIRLGNARAAALFAALLLFACGRGAPAQTAADFDRPLALCESVSAPSGIRAAIASDNDNIILTSDARGALALYQVRPLGNLWATDPANGLLGMGFSGPDEVFSVTRPDGPLTIRRISAASGLVRGFIELPGIESAAVVGSSVASVTRGRLELRTADGKILADAGFPAGSIDGGLSNERAAAVRIAGNGVYLLDRGSGTGRVIGGERARLLALDVRGDVFTAGEGGEIEAYSFGSGDLRWKFRAGGRVTSATVSGQLLVAASNDNFLYALDIAGGAIKWKSRLDDRLLIEPRAKGGIVAVINSLAGVLSVHSLSSGRKLGSFGFDPGERVIAAVPQADGSIAVVTARRIVRIAGNCGK